MTTQKIDGPKDLSGTPELLAADVVVGIMTQGERIHVTMKVELANDPNYSSSNVSPFIIDLGGIEDEGVDPYAVAAELQAAGDALLRLVAIRRGIDLREIEAKKRELRRKANVKRRRLTNEIVEASHCHACPRPVRFVVDGVSYCGRCAEAAGVRPRGKIGGEL